MSILRTEGAVAVFARDLFFRARIEALVEQLGRHVVRDTPASFAVVELGSPQQIERIHRLTEAGTRVLAFGSHVDADSLRTAREAGAVAVPNSRLEAALRTFLTVTPAADGPVPPGRPAS
ncbi:MAG: hypothetical protein OEO20_03055 [Gemmatimonadota bacterium]|nr:hypothetical protein [Gemmatimonadota bacterium]MDH3366654.1 hypothetical protein [Gemmatimonadota bacterium]MDH3477263.1 hypothetical protein [Gemmatimonadota bacterium]